MTNKENNDIDVEMLSIHEEKTPIGNHDQPEFVKEFMTEFNKNHPPEFEIHVADKNITTGAITVSWCVDKEALKKIKKEYRDPCVVIVTAPHNDNFDDDNCYHYSKNERRKVVKLTDLIAYIDFSKPGKNNIFAFIHSDFKTAKEEYLSKSGREWQSSILSYEGKFGLCCDFSAKPLEVNVPENIFANAPPKWEHDWVYWLFPRDKAIDQCDYRRRRIFAYTIQLMPFIVTILVRIVMLFWAILWLNKGIPDFFKNLIHPLRMSCSRVIDTCWTDCLFTVNKKLTTKYKCGYDDNGNEIFENNTERQYRYNWFTPIGLIGLFVIGKFILFLADRNLYLLLIFAGVSVFTAGIAYITFKITFKILGFYQQKVPEQITEEEIDLLVCSENKITSIKDVPKKSIRLRYDDLKSKSKMCKPFSV